MNSQGMCCQSFNKTFFWKTKHCKYIHKYYASIFRLEDSSSFLQCLCLPFPTQHTFLACKTLFVICTCCGNPFFTKATSFQGSSIALKKTIVYTGCSPSIGNASGIRPFSWGKERKHRKEQTKQKMKDKEKKGEERTRSKKKENTEIKGKTEKEQKDNIKRKRKNKEKTKQTNK